MYYTSYIIHRQDNYALMIPKNIKKQQCVLHKNIKEPPE